MQQRQISRPRPRGALRLGLAALAAGCAVFGCGASEAPPALPPGPLIAGDARAFARIVEALEQFDATPLAREALRAGAAVSGCGEFLASTELSAHLFDSPRCDAEAELSPALRGLRGDAALVFVWPLGDEAFAKLASDARPGAPLPRLAGRIHVEADGSLRVEARLDPLPSTSWSRLLIPADAPAGAPRLGTAQALVQGRIRPRAGLDLASLVPPGSQADAMFRLKSELFVGAALGDAWEFAIYMPLPDASMPLMALAVDLASTSLAERGLQSFVSELEAAWPIRAREAKWAEDVSGSCFYELRIMPEFAPCAAIHGDSLVFAWNPQSMARALSEPIRGDADWPGQLVAHFDRFPQADALLERSALGSRLAVEVPAPPVSVLPAEVPMPAATALPAVSAAPPGVAPAAISENGAPLPRRYPFSKLEIRASSEADAALLELRFRRAGAQ